ncbi:protein-glutamate O-methyltransferase CheR [Carboxylicivirga sediminis]|uniref:Protein-glutamate O-methyltransferase CheR n=1 Tax=Carboxylicivirga sediminis TaxID=2006564 RepID=A0A941F7G3_9BACT|nr:CheR family methyltransferase [Carboxylicivirga sediminis]MBR8537055.1 protein-glutamate O-methyltransferase CheR [Carboxylicivirga sediminis]
MDFKHYLQVLKENTPYDFSNYSDNSIKRRLQKVIADNDLTIDELLEKTQNDKGFIERLVEDITVNTTELFRDPELWPAFYEKLLPMLKGKKTFNIWHAGCSSGMEVYSNMILLNELGLLEKARIFATDISANMVRQCKNGSYRYGFNKMQLTDFKAVLRKYPLNGISAIDFSKYFEIDEASDRITVKEFLREKVDVRQHDLVQSNPPFYHKFDIIFCRNVLIYFNANLQSKVYQMFHKQLYPKGAMILGNHESLTGFYNTKFNKNGPVYTKSNSFHFKYH